MKAAAPTSRVRSTKANESGIALELSVSLIRIHPHTSHERGPEPVVSIDFCDMSQNVTKRRSTQPVVVFLPVVESENLK